MSTPASTAAALVAVALLAAGCGTRAHLAPVTRESSGPVQVLMKTLEFTPAAAAKVAELILEEGNPDLKLRLYVTGGGCSGFSYKFDLVPGAEADDVKLERAGATVLIDPVSLEYLSGSEIDFVDDLMGAAFRITNPNATASCGCGNSFAM